LEILKSEYVGEKEGRDGRIRNRKIVEWVVVANGHEFVTSFWTRRDAKAYVASELQRSAGKPLVEVLAEDAS
jgi:hypothetical protein